MALFENHSVLLELKTLSFKEKKKLRSAITENGGNICFAVSKQCSLIVTSDLSNLSSNRLRSIHKHQTPVVGVDYVYNCLNTGVLLPLDEYKLDTSSTSASVSSLKPMSHKVSRASSKATGAPEGQAKPHNPDSPEDILKKYRIYTDIDSKLPKFPDSFQVAKYSFFEKVNSNTWCVLELQSAKDENGRRYRVVRYWKNDIEAKRAAVKDKQVFVPSSEDALQLYIALSKALQTDGLRLRSDIPPQAQDLGSGPLKQLLLEEKLNTGTLSEEVGIFVELLWTEALGCLGNVLRDPINRLSLNDVSRAEGLLLQAQKKLTEGNNSEVTTLMEEFYTLLPHSSPPSPPNVRLISQKLDLCQLIRDVLNVSEMTLTSPTPSCVGKYRALRCNIETVPPGSSEFQAVTALLQGSKVQIKQVLCVSRAVELQMFKSELGNIKPLLHSSSPSNFVGILSRGLLLPRVGVEHHGIERTDIGNLGSGIYFSNAISTSMKYSSPSTTDGSRLLLVCDVALGSCSDLYKRDYTLTQAPEGHHSVHGVQRSNKVPSEFEDDEYVVYSPDQVKLKYVVQFSVEGDQLQNFSPTINTSAELVSLDPELYAEVEWFERIKNPQEDVKAGLLDSSGQQLPLQAVHVKGKLIDLLSEVIIFQKYTNTSSVPIEAKYVFPLDESAAVCGFEAFINGKHVVGQVKEKETARKEYKQAIEKGHGAYLMDQDAPDVFTISVGNLPPGATVLIKVTFLSELIVKDGSIFFSLPGSVAPWQESEALNQTTQITLEKVCMTDVAASTREFTLDMSVEMAYEISSVQCLTHEIKIKKTDCKAVVSVLPGLVMGPEGFQLSISLSDVHLPRMWVEKHPDKDSQACMLVFYPHFEIDSSSGQDEVVVLIDTSESMRGESLRTAQKLALQLLKTLDENFKINVILFGTEHKEAFLTARPMADAHNAAENFIQFIIPIGGSTELWRPLRALSLLPPTRGVRNLLLLSDGHIQNPEPTLKLLRDNAQHSRLFTCGISPTANRHMLRALAQAGAGAYEFFDKKTKHTWPEKVASQVKRMASPGCSSVSVKWQQFNPSAPSPLQAPKHIYALFNDCHTLVFGFVPHCTQATLLGNLSGQELKTMVSTSELQKTKGTFLHKLTARALIRDYEDGNLEIDEAEHEGKKAELKSYIVELSKEFSILSQFTSFVAIEERDSEEMEQGFTDIPKLIAEEDVDILPYISWIPEEETEDELYDDICHYSPSLDMKMRSRTKMFHSDSEYMDDWEETSEDSGSIYELPIPSNETLPLLESISQAAPPPATTVGRYQTSSAAFSARPLVSATGAAPLDQSSLPFPAPPSAPAPSALFCMSDGIPGPIAGVSPSAPPPPPAPRSVLFCMSDGIPGPSFGASASPSAPPPPPPAPRSVLFRMSHEIPGPSFGASASPSAPPPPPPAPRSVLFRMSHEIPGPSFGASRSKPAPPPSLPVVYTEYSAPNFLISETPKFPNPSPPPYLKTRFITTLPSSPPPPHPLELSASVEATPVSSSFSCLSQDIQTSLPSPPDSIRMESAPRRDYLINKRCYNMPATNLIGPLCRRAEPARQAHHVLDICFRECESGQIKKKSASPHILGLFEPKAKSQVLDLSEQTSDDICGFSLVDDFTPSVAESDSLQPQEQPYNLSRKCLLKRCRLKKAKPDSAQALKLKWTKIFQMQHTEGFWELTAELGELINVDVDAFANVFLKNKGINSLGVKARSEILRLVATLLVLQLMRAEKLEEGNLLRTLFCLNESDPRPERWEQVKRAVAWACRADRQYPCVYSRLEFGLSWESSTRQLLGYDVLPRFSPLTGLNLQKGVASIMAC